jgi:hypothetical protein
LHVFIILTAYFLHIFMILTVYFLHIFMIFITYYMVYFDTFKYIQIRALVIYIYIYIYQINCHRFYNVSYRYCRRLYVNLFFRRSLHIDFYKRYNFVAVYHPPGELPYSPPSENASGTGTVYHT